MAIPEERFVGYDRLMQDRTLYGFSVVMAGTGERVDPRSLGVWRPTLLDRLRWEAELARQYGWTAPFRFAEGRGPQIGMVAGWSRLGAATEGKEVALMTASRAAGYGGAIQGL